MPSFSLFLILSLASSSGTLFQEKTFNVCTSFYQYSARRFNKCRHEFDMFLNRSKYELANKMLDEQIIYQDNLTHKINIREAQNLKLTQTNNELVSQAKELNSHISSQTDTISQLNRQLTEKTLETDQLHQKINEQNIELVKIRNLFETLSREHQLVQQENVAFRKELEILREELEKGKKTIDSLLKMNSTILPTDQLQFNAMPSQKKQQTYAYAADDMNIPYTRKNHHMWSTDKQPAKLMFTSHKKAEPTFIIHRTDNPTSPKVYGIKKAFYHQCRNPLRII